LFILLTPLVVLATVDLDDQAGPLANKIHHVLPHRDLASELPMAEPLCSQVIPDLPLRPRHFPAKPLRNARGVWSTKA